MAELDPVSYLRTQLRTAASELDAAHARDEALAEFVPARRILLVARPASMIPRGRVWRLGVLLLTRDGELLRTGRVTRAVDPKWANNQAVSAEVRREHRAAAFASKFPGGETVNFEAQPIMLDEASLRAGADDPDAVLMLRDGEILVRWSAVDRSATMPWEKYLREHVELLVSPPQGT